jgi:hypothetical protein
MVPNTFFQHDHPSNVRAQFPTLGTPASTLSQQHALMIIMFIALCLQDIHCIEHYPLPLTHATVKASTEILQVKCSLSLKRKNDEIQFLTEGEMGTTTDT